MKEIFTRITFLQQRRRTALASAERAPAEFKEMARAAVQRIDDEMAQAKAQAAPIIEAEQDPRLRQILVLKYLEGLTVPQIGESIHYSDPYIFKMIREWLQALK